MHNLYNHIKAILYLGNVLEDINVEHKRCLTIQHFDYNYQSMMSQPSNMMDANEESIMNISIRVQPDMMSQSIYQAYEKNERVVFSVIFNGDFDEVNNLQSYDTAIIVEGYFIRLSEQFERPQRQEEQGSRALMDMRVVMHKIKYVGKNSSLGVVF